MKPISFNIKPECMQYFTADTEMWIPRPAAHVVGPFTAPFLFNTDIPIKKVGTVDTDHAWVIDRIVRLRGVFFKITNKCTGAVSYSEAAVRHEFLPKVVGDKLLGLVASLNVPFAYRNNLDVIERHAFAAEVRGIVDLDTGDLRINLHNHTLPNEYIDIEAIGFGLDANWMEVPAGKIEGDIFGYALRIRPDDNTKPVKYHRGSEMGWCRPMWGPATEAYVFRNRKEVDLAVETVLAAVNEPRVVGDMTYPNALIGDGLSIRGDVVGEFSGALELVPLSSAVRGAELNHITVGILKTTPSEEQQCNV